PMRYEGAVSTATNRAPHHESQLAALRTRREALERKANFISLVRLVLFLLAAALFVAALRQTLALALPFALLCGLAFVFAVIWHARVIAQRHAVDVRSEVHTRYLKRIGGAFQ